MSWYSNILYFYADVCPVEGQVYSTCARPCTFTCDNVNELECITVCTTGCDCPGGQVIDTELNKCVPVKDCPNSNGKCRYVLSGLSAGSMPGLGPCQVHAGPYIYIYIYICTVALWIVCMHITQHMHLSQYYFSWSACRILFSRWWQSHS